MKRSLLTALVLFCSGSVLAGFLVSVAMHAQSVPRQIFSLCIVLGLTLWLLWSLLLRRVGDQMEILERAIDRFPEFAPPHQTDFRIVQPVWLALEGARSRWLQQSETLEEERRKLESVLDSMQDWVIAIDAAGRIRWANEPMRRALHFSVRPGQAIIHAIRDPDALRAVQQSLATGEIIEHRTTGVLPGHVLVMTVSPIQGEGAVAVLRDYTRMEQLERAQREFVANVSHELRTPLTSISGYVETLQDAETFSPAGADFLSTIQKNVYRMIRLTEDLLVLAKVESDDAKFHPEPQAADQLVRDAIATSSAVAKNFGACVKMGELTRARVLADGDSMIQVFANLIENAIKYGAPASGAEARVQVSAVVVDDHVEFRIRDWGKGIALEHMGRIFERFYRIDRDRSRESGGTGLGLSIVRHIVEKHGGTIRVESDLGAGSTFLFTLPLAS